MAEVHSIEIKVDSTQAQNASRNLDKMSGSASGAESALNNLTRAALGLVALDKIAGVAKGILDTNRAMEALRAQLISVTGSAIGAQKAFTFIQNFATSTPYEIEGLTKAFITLQNYGIKPTKQVMEAVTNQASKLGASQETLDGIVRALGQAYAKGKLQAEEMLQLAERGVPVYDLLSQVTGKNAAQLQDMTQKGELTRDVLERLIGKMGELSSGANANAMDTLNGKISNLSDAWHQFEDALLNDKSEGIIKSIVDGISSSLNKLTAEISKSPLQQIEEQLAKAQGSLAQYGPMDRYKLLDGQKIKDLEREIAKLSELKSAVTKTNEEQNKAEDARVAKAEEVKKKILGSDDAVAKSKKSQTAATKALHDAEAAFTSTLQQNITIAQNRAKILDAQAATSKMRLENELALAEEKARIDMKNAQSYQDKLKISADLQAKQEEILLKELALRNEAQTREEELLAVRIASIESEIAAADRFNMTQSERIRLQTELESLQTQQQIMPEERAQIELESIRALNEASRQYNEIRVDGETNVREEALRTLEVLSSNLEYSREMATGLAEAFGEVGSAIGGMSVAMAEYDKQATTIEIARKEAVDKAEGDQKRITEINDDAARKQAKAQIKSYGDMTQAAQGFFKKGTKGYEAMGAAVKVFRVFEMAQSALSFAKQMGDMGAMLAQFLGMESAKTTAKIANNAAQQASDATGAVTSATKAVADAGQGDPYTGIIRAAAMLAFMAAIGIAVGGGGGGSSATTVKPPEPGTGTVKGDPLAVSESISKSIGIIEENSSNDLNYSADMLDALYQIRDALGGVENLIASDLTPIISDLMLKFGDGVKQAGFIFRDQKLSKVLSSGRYEGFIGARIETESSQMMVTIKKGQTMVAEYGDKFARAFGGVIIALKNGIAEVGKVIGVTEKDIVERLKGFTLKGQIVDVAGLSAEDAAKKLEAAFSAMSDTMAMKALPEFKDFQQSGEGYFETISRVAEGINRANGSLELLGMEAIKYTEITDKNKDVAAEITRQTIMAQGDLSEGTRKYVKQLTGSAEDIIDAYKQILNITNLMRGAGFGTENIDRTMINAAGGLSAFEESLQSFRENFMTDQQRVTADTNELTKAFAELGISMPKSKDEFYAIAMGMDTSTEQGKKLFAQFLALNGKFSDLTDASQELADAQAEAAQQAADAARKIQEELISGLQKNVDSAFSAMQKAYQDLQKVQDRFLNYSKNIRAYLDELTGGKSAYISPEERYRIARQEFQRVSALAATGNESALTEITKAGKDFLDASREYNASSQQFQDDFASVTGALESSAKYAETQVNLIASQLSVAESSYVALVNVNNSTLGVQAAISALNSTMGSYASAVATLAKTPTIAPTTPTAPAGSPSNPIPVPKVPVTIQPSIPFIPGGALGFNPYGNNAKIKYSQSDAMNIIRLYYRQLLGREPENDAAILGHAASLINGTKTAKQVADENFKASQEYKDLISKGFVPGFAKGGAMGAGLSLVGEYGPELISSGGGYVSTAGATANFFKTIKDAVVITSAEQTALLKEQIGELQALVRLQSAANRELITQLSEIRNETAESTRIAKVEASA